MIIRPEAPLFFANADQILTRVRRAVANSTATRCVILSLEESPDLDGSSIEGSPSWRHSWIHAASACCSPACTTRARGTDPRPYPPLAGLGTHPLERGRCGKRGAGHQGLRRWMRSAQAHESREAHVDGERQRR